MFCRTVETFLLIYSFVFNAFLNTAETRSLDEYRYEHSGITDDKLIETKRKTKTTFTKEEIDKAKVDVNSKLEVLLESMLANWKHADGTHPNQKASIQGMELEEKQLEKHHENRTNTKRNFGPNIRYLWPDATVPYYINLDSYAVKNKEKVQKVVNQAKADFEAKTCIKLVQKTKDQLEKEKLKPYVYVTNGHGCWSWIGRLSWRERQKLVLQEYGCLYKSTAIHEFCHALGMHHEQSRADRDKHLVIHPENIQTGKEYNLKKQKTLDKNPYDYYSVMQYKLQAFSTKSWVNTITFRDPDLEFLPGLTKGLTFYDVMDITKAYKCNAKCGKDIVCKNGGFVNHKCECYCPKGLTGKSCETIASNKCGGIINLKPGCPVTIKSQNYPNNYDVGNICYWLLRAENKNHRIMIQVKDFELPKNQLSRCYHWLEVRYNLVGQPGPKFCGNKFNRNKISTTEFGNSDMMMLIFDSATVTGVTATKGFSIQAEAVEINLQGCQNAPPQIKDAKNDFRKDDSSVGAIVRYKCGDYSRLVGHNSVTCEADGTWSKPRAKCIDRVMLFKCDFNYGTCGITSDEWIVKKDAQYFSVIQSKASSKALASFKIPIILKYNAKYCLSFKFRRLSFSQQCAFLYVGDKNHRIWRFTSCKLVKEWTFLKGTYEPFYDLSMMFSVEGYGKFNVEIDDIGLSEGAC